MRIVYSFSFLFLSVHQAVQIFISILFSYPFLDIAYPILDVSYPILHTMHTRRSIISGRSISNIEPFLDIAYPILGETYPIMDVAPFLDIAYSILDVTSFLDVAYPILNHFCVISGLIISISAQRTRHIHCWMYHFHFWT